MSLGADGIAAQIKRQAGFAKGAHLHVMSAINARVGEVRLNIIKLKPLLDLPATCLLVPKHEQCGPLAVMSLQCQSSVANIVRKTKQLVGSARPVWKSMVIRHEPIRPQKAIRTV